MKQAIVLVGGALIAFALGGSLLSGWFLLSAGAQTSAACSSPTAVSLGGPGVPAELRPLFEAAAARYELGGEGPAILAGLTKVESDFGRNLGPSSAGAVGWTQFMPETWKRYGVDADGDGKSDPRSAPDAIFAAARYLRALGAPADWHAALLGYNHAEWYVDRVLDTAARLSTGATQSAAELDVLACTPATAPAMPAAGGRVVGGGRIVRVPWQPDVMIDERLLPDLQVLHDRFHIAITDGYSRSSVHAAGGEHPLGLAVDLVPGPGGSWDDIDRLAGLAEPRPDQPVAPWRWVGYDGDPNHGRGNHLHLSWQHGAAASGYQPPAAWVDVMAAAG